MTQDGPPFNANTLPPAPKSPNTVDSSIGAKLAAAGKITPEAIQTAVVGNNTAGTGAPLAEANKTEKSGGSTKIGSTSVDTPGIGAFTAEDIDEERKKAQKEGRADWKSVDYELQELAKEEKGLISKKKPTPSDTERLAEIREKIDAVKVRKFGPGSKEARPKKRSLTGSEKLGLKEAMKAAGLAAQGAEQITDNFVEGRIKLTSSIENLTLQIDTLERALNEIPDATGAEKKEVVDLVHSLRAKRKEEENTLFAYKADGKLRRGELLAMKLHAAITLEETTRARLNKARDITKHASSEDLRKATNNEIRAENIFAEAEATAIGLSDKAKDLVKEIEDTTPNDVVVNIHTGEEDRSVTSKTQEEEGIDNQKPRSHFTYNTRAENKSMRKDAKLQVARTPKPVASPAQVEAPKTVPDEARPEPAPAPAPKIINNENYNKMNLESPSPAPEVTSEATPKVTPKLTKEALKLLETPDEEHEVGPVDSELKAIAEAHNIPVFDYTRKHSVIDQLRKIGTEEKSAPQKDPQATGDIWQEEAIKNFTREGGKVLDAELSPLEKKLSTAEAPVAAVNETPATETIPKLRKEELAKMQIAAFSDGLKRMEDEVNEKGERIAKWGGVVRASERWGALNNNHKVAGTGLLVLAGKDTISKKEEDALRFVAGTGVLSHKEKSPSNERVKKAALGVLLAGLLACIMSDKPGQLGERAISALWGGPDAVSHAVKSVSANPDHKIDLAQKLVKHTLEDPKSALAEAVAPEPITDKKKIETIQSEIKKMSGLKDELSMGEKNLRALDNKEDSLSTKTPSADNHKELAQMEAYADRILSRDIDKLFGSRGFLGFGHVNGLDSINWKDPEVGFGSKTVSEVMSARPNSILTGSKQVFGVENYVATNKIQEYLTNVSRVSGMSLESSESVEDFIRRAAIANAKLTK